MQEKYALPYPNIKQSCSTCHAPDVTEKKSEVKTNASDGNTDSELATMDLLTTEVMGKNDYLYYDASADDEDTDTDIHTPATKFV